MFEQLWHVTGEVAVTPGWTLPSHCTVHFAWLTTSLSVDHCHITTRCTLPGWRPPCPSIITVSLHGALCLAGDLLVRWSLPYHCTVHFAWLVTSLFVDHYRITARCTLPGWWPPCSLIITVSLHGALCLAGDLLVRWSLPYHCTVHFAWLVTSLSVDHYRITARCTLPGWWPPCSLIITVSLHGALCLAGDLLVRWSLPYHCTVHFAWLVTSLSVDHYRITARCTLPGWWPPGSLIITVSLHGALCLAGDLLVRRPLPYHCTVHFAWLVTSLFVDHYRITARCTLPGWWPPCSSIITVSLHGALCLAGDLLVRWSLPYHCTVHFAWLVTSLFVDHYRITARCTLPGWWPPCPSTITVSLHGALCLAGDLLVRWSLPYHCTVHFAWLVTSLSVDHYRITARCTLPGWWPPCSLIITVSLHGALCLAGDLLVRRSLPYHCTVHFAWLVTSLFVDHYRITARCTLPGWWPPCSLIITVSLHGALCLAGDLLVRRPLPYHCTVHFAWLVTSWFVDHYRITARCTLPGWWPPCPSTITVSLHGALCLAGDLLVRWSLPCHCTVHFAWLATSLSVDHCRVTALCTLPGWRPPCPLIIAVSLHDALCLADDLLVRRPLPCHCTVHFAWLVTSLSVDHCRVTARCTLPGWWPPCPLIIAVSLHDALCLAGDLLVRWSLPWHCTMHFAMLTTSLSVDHCRVTARFTLPCWRPPCPSTITVSLHCALCLADDLLVRLSLPCHCTVHFAWLVTSLSVDHYRITARCTLPGWRPPCPSTIAVSLHDALCLAGDLLVRWSLPYHCTVHFAWLATSLSVDHYRITARCTLPGWWPPGSLIITVSLHGALCLAGDLLVRRPLPYHCTVHFAWLVTSLFVDHYRITARCTLPGWWPPCSSIITVSLHGALCLAGDLLVRWSLPYHCTVHFAWLVTSLFVDHYRITARCTLPGWWPPCPSTITVSLHGALCLAGDLLVRWSLPYHCTVHFAWLVTSLSVDHYRITARCTLPGWWPPCSLIITVSLHGALCLAGDLLVRRSLPYHCTVHFAWLVTSLFVDHYRITARCTLPGWWPPCSLIITVSLHGALCLAGDLLVRRPLPYHCTVHFAWLVTSWFVDHYRITARCTLPGWWPPCPSTITVSLHGALCLAGDLLVRWSLPCHCTVHFAWLATSLSVDHCRVTALCTLPGWRPPCPLIIAVSLHDALCLADDLLVRRPLPCHCTVHFAWLVTSLSVDHCRVTARCTLPGWWPPCPLIIAVSLHDALCLAGDLLVRWSLPWHCTMHFAMLTTSLSVDHCRVTARFTLPCWRPPCPSTITVSLHCALCLADDLLVRLSLPCHCTVHFAWLVTSLSVDHYRITARCTLPGWRPPCPSTIAVSLHDALCLAGDLLVRWSLPYHCTVHFAWLATSLSVDHCRVTARCTLPGWRPPCPSIITVSLHGALCLAGDLLVRRSLPCHRTVHFAWLTTSLFVGHYHITARCTLPGWRPPCPLIIAVSLHGALSLAGDLLCPLIIAMSLHGALCLADDLLVRWSLPCHCTVHFAWLATSLSVDHCRITARCTLPGWRPPCPSTPGGAAWAVGQSGYWVASHWERWRHTLRSLDGAATGHAWRANTVPRRRSQAGPSGAERGSSRTASSPCRTAGRTPRLRSCCTWPTSRCNRNPGQQQQWRRWYNK